jgi:hypothetical protein
MLLQRLLNGHIFGALPARPARLGSTDALIHLCCKVGSKKEEQTAVFSYFCNVYGSI